MLRLNISSIPSACCIESVSSIGISSLEIVFFKRGSTVAVVSYFRASRSSSSEEKNNKNQGYYNRVSRFARLHLKNVYSKV